MSWQCNVLVGVGAWLSLACSGDDDLRKKMVGVRTWRCATRMNNNLPEVRDILHFEKLDGQGNGQFKKGGVVPNAAPAKVGGAYDGAYVHIRQVPAFESYPERWVEWRGWWRLRKGKVSFTSTETYTYASARRAGHWGASKEVQPGTSDYRVLDPGRAGLRFESAPAHAHTLAIVNPGGGCSFRATRENVPERPALSKPAPPTEKPAKQDSAARKACLAKCEPADLMCNMGCAK